MERLGLLVRHGESEAGKNKVHRFLRLCWGIETGFRIRRVQCCKKVSDARLCMWKVRLRQPRDALARNHVGQVLRCEMQHSCQG